MRPDESRKVVVVPDVLEVVEILPVPSLNVAFLPASEDAGSAKARTGISRNRISFIDDLDDSWAVFFIMTARPLKAESSNIILHALRKTIGSLMANKFGIQAAERLLRHTSPTITSKFYTDKEAAVVPGIGALLQVGMSKAL